MKKTILIFIFFQFYLYRLPAQNHMATEFFQRGEVELHLGDFGQAIKNYTQAIALFPNYVQAYFSRGRVYQLSQKPENALADFLKVTALHPRYADAYFYIGTLYYQNAEAEKAIPYFNQAIQEDTTRAIFYNYRAEAFLELGLLVPAIADYNQAIRYDHTTSVLYFGRGKCHQAKGEYQAAVQDFTQAIRLEPRKFEYRQFRAETHFVAGNYAQAGADIDTMIATDKTKVEVQYYSLNAFCKAQSDSFTAAVFIMDELLKMRPPNAALYTERADYHQHAKNYTAALEDYQRALQFDSTQLNILKKCTELLFFKQRYPTVIAYTNHILTQETEDAQIWYWRGIAHLNLEHKQEAKTDLTRAVQLGYPKANLDKRAVKLVKKAP
jgi:tetratricopeptide (TPR) repeat protein